MTAEHSTHSERKVLLVDSGEGHYKPILINSSIQDPLSQFVNNQSNSLQSRIDGLQNKKSGLSKKTTHNRMRSDREIGDIFESLDTQINQARAQLEVLDGKNLQPIKLEKRGEKIVGFQMASFKTQEEAEFWKFVKSEIFEVTDIVNKFPRALDWLIEGFSLRYSMNFGRTADERRESRERYEDFRKRYGDLSDEQASLLWPIIRKISTTFSG